MSGDSNGSKSPFVRPRIAAGLALVAIVGTLYFLDYTSPDFTFDSIQLGLLLGTALLFLGVEAGRKLIG